MCTFKYGIEATVTHMRWNLLPAVLGFHVSSVDIPYCFDLPRLPIVDEHSLIHSVARPGSAS